MGFFDRRDIEEMKGKTLSEIALVRGKDTEGDSIIFETTDGEKYRMYHEDD